MLRHLFALLCLLSLLLLTQAGYGRGRGAHHRHPDRHRGGYGYGTRRDYGRPSSNGGFGGGGYGSPTGGRGRGYDRPPNVPYGGGGYGRPPPTPPCNAPCHPSYGTPGDRGCTCPGTQAPPTTWVTQDLSTTTYTTPETTSTTQGSTTTTYTTPTTAQGTSTTTSTLSEESSTTTSTTQESTTTAHCTPPQHDSSLPNFCEINVTKHCNEIGIYVPRNTGPFLTCAKVLSNHTVDAWNCQCLVRLCDRAVSIDGYQLNETVKCILYEEFAEICNAALPEGNKLYQQTEPDGPDLWRRIYRCPAPTTTTATPTRGSLLLGDDPFGTWKRSAGVDDEAPEAHLGDAEWRGAEEKNATRAKREGPRMRVLAGRGMQG